MVGQIVEDVKRGLDADAPPFTLTMSAPDSSTCMIQDVLSRTAFELYRYPPKPGVAASRRQISSSARESNRVSRQGCGLASLAAGASCTTV